MSSVKSSGAGFLPVVEPEEVGLSSERLARIPPAMQEYIDRQEVPCVLTLVARHGKVAHFEVQGFRDIDASVPVEKNAIFRLWSMTKPITGVATLMLHEEGHFQLDDPVSRFLPVFKNPVVAVSEPPRGQSPTPGQFGLTVVPAHREITIRDCLTNTTGLASLRRTPIALLTPYREALRGSGWFPMEQAPASLLTMQERIDRLAKIPLSFHPGTAWEYGMSLSVAGVLVELISGKTLNDFFKERIFEPLEMKDSSFNLPKDKLSRLCTSYRLLNEGDRWKMRVADRPEISEQVTGPNVMFSGGGEFGGVLSTVPDYARFAQMLLNGGELNGVRLLNRKTVELMTTNHTGNLYVYSRGHGYGSGLGVGVRTELVGPFQVGSVGQYGWGGAACTHYFADPNEDLLGLMFSQVEAAAMKPDFTLIKDFERLVYQALE